MSIYRPGPLAPHFWKNFVTVLHEYNRRQTHTEMRDLLEVKQAFEFSLRFFENLTDPNYLYLGAGIQQEAGDIENSCQTLARIIQNFPSFKKMRMVVLKAAACELHAGNLPQSQSYFEFFTYRSSINIYEGRYLTICIVASETK